MRQLSPARAPLLSMERPITWGLKVEAFYLSAVVAHPLNGKTHNVGIESLIVDWWVWLLLGLSMERPITWGLKEEAPGIDVVPRGLSQWKDP